MKSAIEKAVVLAEHIPPARIEGLSVQLALVSTQVNRGLALFDNLLGIEEASKSRVENGLTVLKREQTYLKNCITFGSKYRLLSMEPLTWRDKNGWPRLVVFNLDSPHFKITVSGQHTYKYGWSEELIIGKNNIDPAGLPKAIKACYKDVQVALLKKLKEMGGDGGSVELSCRFEGLIPDDIKQKIIEARGELFEEIFLIAEPEGFEINETAIIVPKHDPLVVGFDGSQLWLIADFETTPVEEAMIFLSPGVIKN